jgi:hypothetical protein
MPEQLLDCHYIHASIYQTRSKRVSQRMPRYVSNLRLFARLSDINKRFAGLEIVEYTAQRFGVQDLIRFALNTGLRTGEIFTLR